MFLRVRPDAGLCVLCVDSLYLFLPFFCYAELSLYIRFLGLGLRCVLLQGWRLCFSFDRFSMFVFENVCLNLQVLSFLGTQRL